MKFVYSLILLLATAAIISARPTTLPDCGIQYVSVSQNNISFTCKNPKACIQLNYSNNNGKIKSKCRCSDKSTCIKCIPTLPSVQDLKVPAQIPQDQVNQVAASDVVTSSKKKAYEQCKATLAKLADQGVNVDPDAACKIA
ncbi:hypothetical protein MP228_012849 [Amoeboaphelidium protococcarum]|nr:hypothetical protein MP228_012849 [Amoeboaphelidium protococcarum]